MSESERSLALVIDDEQDIRRVVRLALEHEGWQVTESTNGREGLGMIRRLCPGMVIIDLMLPEMSAIEVMRRLASEPSFQDMPTLLISGVNRKAQVLQDFWDLPLRYKDFLPKPFSAKQLIKHVQALKPPSHHRVDPRTPRTQPDAAESSESAPPTAPPWLRAAEHNRPTRQQAHKPSPPASPPPQQPVADTPKAFGDEPRQQPPSPPRPEATSPTPTGEDRTPSPRQAHPTQAGEIKAQPIARRPEFRILIVDDDPDICALLRAALGTYFTVETADNGMQALADLEPFAPDLIILDINMPVLGGLETAEAIRRHPIFRRMPIFFLTGESNPQLPRKAFDVGGNLYLRKPIDPMQMVRYIDYFLKETGLQPGEHGAQPAPAKTREPADPATAAKDRLRILTCDYNIEDHRLLKKLLEEKDEHPPEIQGGPFELIWSEDPYLALGNIGRWEPDLILYNPRNPHLDGVAFGQMLLMNEQIGRPRIAFIGTRFFEADQSYSKRHFGLEVIELNTEREQIKRKLQEAIRIASRHIRPKQLTHARIRDEEIERLKTLQARNARQVRQRQSLRKQFEQIQQFIDTHFE